MRLSEIRIENYRSAKRVEFKLNNFVCIIGANNAGKSTLLYAIELLFSGGTLQDEDFYNKEELIQISCELTGIGSGDLLRVSEAHRGKVEPLIDNGCLKLKRKFSPGERSRLWTQRTVPIDSRYDLVEEAIKGKRQGAIRDALNDLLPEHSELFADVNTKAKALSAIETAVGSLPADKLESRDATLPTGIEGGISDLLPETVYIPASKDVKEDLKTSASARFGKLLGLLVEAIEATPYAGKIDESFDLLHGMFNRVADTEGIQKDERIDPIRILETAVEVELKTQFRNATIELDIPKPELKQLFTNGQILVNDGINNSILLKGDGVKRSVMFSMIKVYIDLVRHNKLISSTDITVPQDDEVKPRPYLFLFEEPELFLHPNAQQILYQSLKELSTLSHQVCITTHSPSFFGPGDDTMFIKISKGNLLSDTPPYANVKHVDLSSKLLPKQAYQITCYENNAAAFFSDRIILVEGPSDQMYLTALAKRLNEEWCLVRSNTAIVQIGGKTNVAKYRSFYEAAGIEVFVIVDYDAIFNGFNNLGLPSECLKLRSKVIQDIDTFRESVGDAELTGPELKKVKASSTFKLAFSRLRMILDSAIDRRELSEVDIESLKGLFEKSNTFSRRAAFRDTRFKSSNLRRLSSLLLDNRCYILTKGTIESYYPSGLSGSQKDKQEYALRAIERIAHPDWNRNELPTIEIDGCKICELSMVLQHAFNATS